MRARPRQCVGGCVCECVYRIMAQHAAPAVYLVTSLLLLQVALAQQLPTQQLVEHQTQSSPIEGVLGWTHEDGCKSLQRLKNVLGVELTSQKAKEIKLCITQVANDVIILQEEK